MTAALRPEPALVRATVARSRSRRVHVRILVSAILALDVVVIAATTAASVASRQSLPGLAEASDVSDHVRVSVGFVAAGWAALIACCGGYQMRSLGAGTEEYRAVATASVLTAACVGIGCYVTQFPLSRGFSVLEFTIGTPTLLLGRVLARRVLHRLRSRGHARLRILIAGDHAHVDEIAAVLRRECWLGYDVIGAVTRRRADTQTPGGIPVVGSFDSLAMTARAQRADVVFFVGGAGSSSADLRRTAWDLEPLDVEMIVVPSLTEVGSERIAVRPVAGLPLVHLAPPRAMAAGTWLKRAFDVVGAGLLMLLSSPLMMVTAALIKADDRGPVFFSQTRVGRHGERFTCWKLRTMVPQAEGLVAELTSTGANQVLFKIQRDPRVTRLGAVLRRRSLDELPQLWNVLLGDMSLVGPRPPLESEVARYTPEMQRRLRVRPGITGLWQVSGRSDLSWEDTVRLDLYYVENWSLLQDVSILIRTVGAVMGSRGAY